MNGQNQNLSVLLIDQDADWLTKISAQLSNDRYSISTAASIPSVGFGNWQLDRSLPDPHTVNPDPHTVNLAGSSINSSLGLSENGVSDVILIDMFSAFITGEFFSSSLFAALGSTTTYNAPPRVFLNCAGQKSDIVFRKFPFGSYYCLRKPDCGLLLSLLLSAESRHSNDAASLTTKIRNQIVIPPIQINSSQPAVAIQVYS